MEMWEKLGEHLEKLEKVLEIFDKGIQRNMRKFWRNLPKISCNFQKNLKKWKGKWRKYAIIVKTF